MADLLSRVFELCPRVSHKISRYLELRDLEILATALSATLRGRCGRHSLSFRRQIELAGGYSHTYHIHQVHHVLGDVKALVLRPSDITTRMLHPVPKERRRLKVERIGELMDLGARHLQQASAGPDTPELEMCAEVFYEATRIFWATNLTRDFTTTYASRLEGFEDFRGIGVVGEPPVRKWARAHARLTSTHHEADLTVLFGN